MPTIRNCLLHLALASAASASSIAISLQGDIWLVDPETSAMVQLTTHPGYDGQPSWSPDGERILFVSTREQQRGQLYSIHRDGSQLTSLGVNGTDPTVAPDGRQVLYTSGLRLILSDLVGADSFSLLELSEGDISLTSPSWAPDGTRLVFGVSPGLLYTMDLADAPCAWTSPAVFAECPSLTRLVNGTVDDSNPAWSPDGDWIAFQDHFRISVVRPDGTGLRPLTDATFLAREPTWSPDSRQIAFVGSEAGELYVMNSDGTSLRQLTHIGDVRDPAWHYPDEETIQTSTWGILKQILSLP